MKSFRLVEMKSFEMLFFFLQTFQRLHQSCALRPLVLTPSRHITEQHLGLKLRLAVRRAADGLIALSLNSDPGYPVRPSYF